MLCLLVGGRAVARPYTKNSKGSVGTAYWLSANLRVQMIRQIPIPLSYTNSANISVYHD